MISLETTRKKLFDLLVAKGFELTTRDSKGKETVDPAQADLYSFDYKAQDTSYGTVVITISSNGELEVFYGDVLGKGMDAEDKTKWYEFLYQLRMFSKRSMLEFSLKHMNKLKYSMQTMAQVTESNYYGFKKTSYSKQTKEAKLKIIHSKPIDEEAGDQRYRNIAALYVETSDGERFKLPFNKLYGGRAMARHVSEGGNPYDQFGQYISELVDDIQTLGAFTRYARSHEWADVQSTDLAERGIRHFGDIKRKVKTMIGKRGYGKAFKEYQERGEQPQQETVEKIRELFTERLLDQRVESALPVLAKLELEGKSMKEINEFEKWTEQMTVVDEGFDPDNFDGEITVGDGEEVYYHAEVDKEQNTVHVTQCSDEQYADECQADAEAEWDARDADVPMEDVELDEGKMKELHYDLENASDEEFEKTWQSKKSDWQEVKTPGLRQDPNKPAYIGKMTKHAGDLAAESTDVIYRQADVEDAIKIANSSTGAMTVATDSIDAIADGLSNHPDVQAALKKANESTEVTEEYAPAVGDQVVTAKGTKGTIEVVGEEAVEVRTETGKLYKVAVGNIQPDTVNEDDVDEGNEFSLALANAKRDGKKDFEVDGKMYTVTEDEIARLKYLINR